jgi:hypothetical protein
VERRGGVGAWLWGWVVGGGVEFRRKFWSGAARLCGVRRSRRWRL